MSVPTVPKTAKLPFFVADLFLLAAAYFIFEQNPKPLEPVAQGLIVLCALGAAFLGILPFILDFRAVVRVAEAESLTSVVAQIQRLDEVADHIRGATAQWQGVQESSTKTVAGARTIAETMSKEVEGFKSFLEQADNKERATLRLEIDKARRAEAEWVQLVVHLLDHVYALHKGAIKSGLPAVVDQVGRFQHACREVVRRVGLTPFSAGPEEKFNPERHQLMEGNDKGPVDGVVSETVATGYTYQGRLVRPALVKLQVAGDGGSAAATPAPAAAGTGQDQLPLGNS